jgi:hypothetical protein
MWLLIEEVLRLAALAGGSLRMTAEGEAAFAPAFAPGSTFLKT